MSPETRASFTATLELGGYLNVTSDKERAVIAAIKRCRSELNKLEKFVDLTIRAFSQAADAKRMLELCRDTGLEYSDEEFVAALAKAEETESFARPEQSSGFPYLFGVSVIKMWSLIEAMVDDLAVECLSEPEKCEDKQLIDKLSGPLIEFVRAGPEQQAQILAREVKLAVGASQKRGVGRFEAVLRPLGLGGGVHSDVRKVSLELSECRHVHVHRASTVDQRLVETCPWLSLQVGNELHQSYNDFSRFQLAAYWYVLELEERWAVRSQTKGKQNVRDLQERIVEYLPDGHKEGCPIRESQQE